MDTVKITIPASPQFLQAVRLVASGLASRLNFTIEDIEDLKIAVDELSAYLTGAQGRDGEIRLEFGVHSDRIEIIGAGYFGPGEVVRTDLTEFSHRILETVVDDASLAQLDGVPTFKLVKSKGS